MEVFSREQQLLDKMIADSMLQKYGSVCKRERVHVTSVSLGFIKIYMFMMLVSALPHSHVLFYKAELDENQCVDFQGITNLDCQAYLRRYYMETSCFDPSGSSSLYHFNSSDVLFCTRVPD